MEILRDLRFWSALFNTQLSNVACKFNIKDEGNIKKLSQIVIFLKKFLTKLFLFSCRQKYVNYWTNIYPKMGPKNESGPKPQMSPKWIQFENKSHRHVVPLICLS